MFKSTVTRAIRTITVTVALITALSACSGGAHSDESIAASVVSVSGQTSVIQTEDGPIQGLVSEGVDQFLGIPYAAPPTGNLRWEPPQSPTKWTTTKETVAYGDTCPQTNTIGAFAAKSTTEDCLYLNVFAPQGATQNSALPVMFWVHGGGLSAGASNPYDGSSLVKKGNVIVVTINYRVNVFGFLAVPALDQEGHTFGNYGLMDQQFALKWVQSNIAQFGGDPNNVTIFGESAGGKSVMANIASPTAAGLFQHAIVESGDYGDDTAQLSDLTNAEAQGNTFVQEVGCASQVASQVASCLRSLSVEEIQS